jgi:hypothetical protein
MNKKPFDPTKPVQTRDNRAARILPERALGPQPIVALVVTRKDETPFADRREAACTYNENGHFFSSGEEHFNDLINIPSEPTYRPWTAEEAAELGVCGCTVRYLKPTVDDAKVWRTSINEVNNDYIIVKGVGYDYRSAFEAFEIFLNGIWQRCGVKI